MYKNRRVIESTVSQMQEDEGKLCLCAYNLSIIQHRVEFTVHFGARFLRHMHQNQLHNEHFYLKAFFSMSECSDSAS